MAYARKTIASDKILLQKAGSKSIFVGKCLDIFCRVCNMFLEMGIEKNCEVKIMSKNILLYIGSNLMVGKQN